jgi:hypothetical protein
MVALVALLESQQILSFAVSQPLLMAIFQQFQPVSPGRTMMASMLVYLAQRLNMNQHPI